MFLQVTIYNLENIRNVEFITHSINGFKITTGQSLLTSFYILPPNHRALLREGIMLYMK